MKKHPFYGIALLWLCVVASAWATPLTDRNWDIDGKTVLRLDTGGSALVGEPRSSSGVLKFNPDGTVVSTQWVGRLYYSSDGRPADVVGQWQSSGTDQYGISIQLPLLNVNDNTAYIARLKQDYQALTGEDKEIRKITFIAYADKGKILDQGQTIKGKNTAVLDLELAAPGVSQTKTTRATVVTTYQGQRSKITSACCSATGAALNTQLSQAFLTKTAKLPSVEVTASGLQYQVLQRGYGKSPAETNQVTVNYRGLLPSGVIFDSGTRITFPLRSVIAGWTEGLQLMKVGAKYRFYIPADLAYGEQGTGGSIGPNAALVFDVELLGFK